MIEAIIYVAITVCLISAALMAAAKFNDREK